MAKKRIGKLPPRYSFILNPHRRRAPQPVPPVSETDSPAKFALFIHIDAWARWLSQGLSLLLALRIDHGAPE